MPTDATAMRPHSDRIQSHDATHMLSEQLLATPSNSDPRNSARVRYELDRSGMPHITEEIAKEIEALMSRPITTLHGTWAGELDRLVEERGGGKVVDALSGVCQKTEKPSWPQAVAGVRNILEPLPAAMKSGPIAPAEARKAEISDAVRALKAVK